MKCKVEDIQASFTKLAQISAIILYFNLFADTISPNFSLATKNLPHTISITWTQLSMRLCLSSLTPCYYTLFTRHERINCHGVTLRSIYNQI